MIIAMTTFALSKALSLAEAQAIFMSTAPKYEGVAGLQRKHYVISEDGLTVGGIYLWNSMQDAHAMYTEEWRTFVREKYDTEPTVTYFASPVTVDNVARQVFSDGQ